jgi:hypothetical protein
LSKCLKTKSNTLVLPIASCVLSLSASNSTTLNNIMNKVLLLAALLYLVPIVSDAQDIFATTERITSGFNKKNITYLKKNALVAFEANAAIDNHTFFKGNIDGKSIQFGIDRIRISSKKMVGLFTKKTQNCNWSVGFLNTSEQAKVIGNKKIFSKDGKSSAFSEVWYKEIYHSIDARFYSNTKDGVRYSVVVKPHADPNQIALKLQGVNRLNIEKNNTLSYKTPDGISCKSNIKAYQLIDGEEVAVELIPRIRKNVLRFGVLGYNRDYPLIIDAPLLISEEK